MSLKPVSWGPPEPEPTTYDPETGEPTIEFTPEQRGISGQQEQTPPPASSAALCRSRGWGVGTVLEGSETWPAGTVLTSRIVITAVGEEGVLARLIAERMNSEIWEPVSPWWVVRHEHRMLGNAVCPPVAEAIGRELIKAIGGAA